ncbi:phosphotransferase [Nocardioides sp. IC4_145]|uniref:phosphotransferase n=1 Tax=Nocardioides sp. IC4_145 TaxID=2714037 RepID=UPI0014072665|nr:phosphotransferase [Nocardioides sp. IC4_145]NHC25443.1 phosphotransferase [Nocardioides sp. IC4_145]
MAERPLPGAPIAPRRTGRLADRLGHPLLRNGYALVLNSGASAVLGMAFWVLAARRFPVEEVGIGSALVAALALLSTLAQLDLANVLARFLPTAGRHSDRMILACLLAAAAAAAVLGSLFVAGARWWAPSLPLGTGDPRLDAWFVVALVLWTLFVLQDGALSGLRRSDWVLVKNAALGALRLLALLVPAVAVASSGVFVAWTVPVVAVLVVLGVLLARQLVPRHVARTASAAQPATARQVARFACLDYVVALVSTGVTSALPLLVLEVSGAATAAYFTLAWSISYSLYLVSRSMATSLLVEGAGDTARLDEYSWRALVHTISILAPLVAATVLLAPLLMRLFGAEYADGGTTVLRLLALSTLPTAVVVVYTAVERVRRRMRRLLLVTVAVHATALALIWVLLRTSGLAGLGLAWLGTQSVAAVLLLGTVLRPVWLPRVGGRPVALAACAASRVRAALHGRGRDRLLRGVYPDLAATLSLDQRWQVRRVLPTVGDVVVAEVGGSTAEGVLKLALTARGSEALTSSHRAVRSLASDPRLPAGWAALLPRTLATGRDAAGRAAVVERYVDGQDGRLVLAHPAGLADPVAVVLDRVGSLHEHTGRDTVVDEHLLATWVDEPVATLERWLADPATADATGALREALRRGLAGRVVTRCWTHGDLAPGNVVLSDDGRHVSGVIDWERARPDGLAEVDSTHFLLTVRMLREDRELGDLVRDLLARPGSGEDALGDPSLVLLAWLDHVAGIVTKTGHYSPGGWWAARNVRPVLHQVRSQAQSHAAAPEPSPVTARTDA